MKLFRRKPLPRWEEGRIKELYRQCISEVIRLRNAVNQDSMLANGEVSYDKKLVVNLRKYSFAVGEVAALETLMDRLFIDYDDEGKVPELYL